MQTTTESLSVLGKVRRKFKQGLATKWCFDRLSGIGISIIPFYVMLEDLNANTPTFDSSQYADLELFNPTVENVVEMSSIAADAHESARRKRFAAGDFCLGLRKDGKIIAFSWAMTPSIYCTLPYVMRPLASNEAYLFDAVTAKAFRGRAIASYLRMLVYKELEKQGRTRFYSISETFNTSSIKFKQRLGARFLEYGITIGLGKRYRTFILKRYCLTP